MVRQERHFSTSRLILAACAALALTGCEARFEDGSAAAAQTIASLCEPIMFEGSRFTLCIADPAQHEVSTALAPELGGEPYRSFAALEEVAGEEMQQLAMATNGGMFDDDGQPIGYYVENGSRLTVLNEREGDGNFYKMPNGVFFGEEDGGWQVMESREFAANASERPSFATQSGPMLVINGRLHPNIAFDGESRAIRNGVGVDAIGRAQFVISDDPVSFGKLARLYRDVLNVENALYLDGVVSQLWDPANDRMDDGESLGPLILVENRSEAAS